MNTITIPCPSCDTLNRMPAERRGELGRRGKCGKCGAPLFTGEPIALTAVRFARHAEARDLPMLVDFWAAWCGPCRAMAPIFEQTARALEPQLRFAKVDTDAEPELAARFDIRAIPTMVLIQGGREVARHSGTMPAGTLRYWIEEHLRSQT